MKITVLDNLKMTDNKGKERKINKTAIENIKIFLELKYSVMKNIISNI